METGRNKKLTGPWKARTESNHAEGEHQSTRLFLSFSKREDEHMSSRLLWATNRHGDKWMLALLFSSMSSTLSPAKVGKQYI
jgi:hypothetical protein